ncbi:MAG TPA: hypothetical protein DHN33_06835 [Eubacteriaceae bacterium]|nr:hypothetical protein [Eubacteriaceae bacterium]
MTDFAFIIFHEYSLKIFFTQWFDSRIIPFFQVGRKIKEPGRCWYYLGNNRVNTLKEALE